MAMSLDDITKEVEECKFDLTNTKEMFEEIIKAQEETGGALIFRAKPPSGGGKNFIITVGGDEEIEIPEITGVIIHNHKCNALYPEGVLNTPPLCCSDDGKLGYNEETGETNWCSDCEHNEYGTGKNGRGKACKNMHRIYILTEEIPVPIVLSLPPTSLKAWRQYRLGKLALCRKKPYEVVTKLTLSTEINEDKQKFSVIKFELIGAIEKETKLLITEFSSSFKPRLKITGEDYERLAGNTEEAEKEKTY